MVTGVVALPIQTSGPYNALYSFEASRLGAGLFAFGRQRREPRLAFRSQTSHISRDFQGQGLAGGPAATREERS